MFVVILKRVINATFYFIYFMYKYNCINYAFIPTNEFANTKATVFKNICIANNIFGYILIVILNAKKIKSIILFSCLTGMILLPTTGW